MFVAGPRRVSTNPELNFSKANVVLAQIEETVVAETGKLVVSAHFQRK